jgi:hypothetical protein
VAAQADQGIAAAAAEPLPTEWFTPAAPATSPAPQPPPAPSANDDDAYGVPSVPWSFATPESPAEPAPPDAAPADDEDDELGVPFGPFSLPADSGDITDTADAVDLPRPPALTEEPLHPTPAPATDALAVAPPPIEVAPDMWTPGPVRTHAHEPFPIAPLEGFHLTDPDTFELPADAPADDNPYLAPTTPDPTAPQPAHTARPDALDAAHLDPNDDGSWRIRQSPRAQLLAERMAQKRREETARVAFHAAAQVNEPERGRKKRRGGHDDSPPDVASARRQLDEHLRKKRGAEAGALLQRLAQELGGRDIADLALDAGDRCRALGQSRSATNCYLAAWRADPLYETPLWRLSDVCLNDQEIELAVGYLERIAELMRSRSDDEGAIGVYRKIAMIAPERQDVRDVIRLAKTTGRLDG